MPRRILVKTKSGLLNGLSTKFYTWKGDKPPEDTNGLTPIAESVSLNINFLYTDRPHPQVPPDYFMIEWNGYLRIDFPGTYRFYVITSDGCKVWVNKELLINEWYDQPSRLHLSREIRLLRGFHPIRVLYYNRFKFGEISLGWIRPDGVSEVIPQNHFHFIVSNKVFFTGIIDDYRILLKSVSSGKTYECSFINQLCMITILEEVFPVLARIELYNSKGETEFILDTPVEIWGGDEYLIK
ncbi:MAG: PA14 domain-containing protein [Thermosphaera sp.]